MKVNISLALKLTCIFVIMTVLDVFAGPTIIRDNRATDIGITPALGRGYTISTNTYQSICLKDVKLTEPSYDFTYTFRDLKSSTATTKTNTTDRPQLVDPIINNKFRKYMLTITPKADTKVTSAEVKKVGDATTKVESSVKTRTMIAVIDLESYYASVDEASSSMSDSAKNLLNNNDLPGFFSSCGSYYVRGINRRAKLVSIFRWKESSTTKDYDFAGKIESRIKGFREKINTTTTTSGAWWWKRKKTVTTVEKVAVADQVDSEAVSENFNEVATKSNLSITTVGFGLGKSEDASLISYDIDSFKDAIKQAFMVMQNPRTGKVTSIEVVPWVENTEFQDLVKLNEPLTVPATKDAAGNKVAKKILQPFEMKHNMSANAEFLAEINKNDRNMMNLYYKAGMCKKIFDSKWRDPNGKLKPEYKGKLIFNNKTGGAVPIETLGVKLTAGNIESLYKKEQEFMYTGKNSAARCMSAMIKNDIRTQIYKSIKECVTVEKNMGNIEDEIIDNYCMPSLTTVRKRK